ncbi:hypothetical protein H8E07_03565 [bacterium]|nr:hypothetical protein [bacterium]
MGHAHPGGKTVLYLIDGLYSVCHPYELQPQHWGAEPFNGDWTSSLFASQDPVAIESVRFEQILVASVLFGRVFGVHHGRGIRG